MNAMGIIFANIYDSSLGELTNKRTMASLPYGGRYRQIDFTLSNMSNSGIRHIGIISRYNYQSLMNHIGSGQEWDLELEEFGLEFLTPNSNQPSTVQVRGKLEALYASIDYLERANAEYVVLADSGVLCNMDMKDLLEKHIASGKDLTVATKAGIANGKKQLDLALKLSPKGEVSDLTVDYCADSNYLASMDIFVIGREKLLHLVRESVARNLYRLERDQVLFNGNTPMRKSWPVGSNYPSERLALIIPTGMDVIGDHTHTYTNRGNWTGVVCNTCGYNKTRITINPPYRGCFPKGTTCDITGSVGFTCYRIAVGITDPSGNTSWSQYTNTSSVSRSYTFSQAGLYNIRIAVRNMPESYGSESDSISLDFTLRTY